ncbi:MAG: hypothetical protein PHQ75_05300, partial [Thermoguttaceae bacterium]|nr:hypothetical protein [Thermoguttaceae bacterium]
MFRKFLENLFIGFLLCQYCFTLCSSCCGQTKETMSDKEVPGNLSVSSDKVVRRYLNILLETPRYGAVFDRVYYHYSEKNAIRELLQKLENVPLAANAESKGKRLFLQGLVYSRQNDLDRAVDMFRKAHELQGDNSFFSMMLGKTLIFQGFLQEGAHVLEESVKRNIPESEKTATLVLLGETWLRLNKPEKAETVWKTMTDDSSTAPESLSRLATIRENLGQYRDALNLYEKMIQNARRKIDKESEIKFSISAADIKIRLGDKKGAIEDCERLLDEISEDHWLASPLRDRIEQLFLQQADYGALLDYYEAREKSHPNDRDCLLRQALVLSGLSRLDEAKKVLEKGIRKFPSSLILRKTLAELEVEQNHFDLADRLYEEIDSLEPNNPDTLIAWGKCVFHHTAIDEQTRTRKTVEIWKRLLVTCPNDRTTILLVADTMIENGLYVEAEPLLERLVVLFPDDHDSYERLADFYFLNMNEKKAFDILNQMTSGHRKTNELLVRKADCLRKHKYLHEAALAVQQAVELNPDKFETKRLLLEILLDSGEYKEIETVFAGAEATAKSDNEKHVLFSLRLRYLREVNGLDALVDELDKSIKTASENTPNILPELYWKKVSLLLYLEDPETATDTAIAALEKKATSELLFQRAVETVNKSQNPEKSLKLLTLLIAANPKESSGYLKTMACIQLELGCVDEALATGKKMLKESGTGSNYRIYADILLACGQVEEAVEILRCALRLDSKDQAALTKLAGLLDSLGKTNEAINLQWQVFNRSSRIEEKMQSVDILAKYYQQLDQFDVLKDQLISSSRDATSRRENTYCLARAYTSVQDYASAQKTLESLLSFSDKDNQDEEFLLHHLSGLAEMQNDLPRAIAFQERLCAKIGSPVENERLLALYNRSDDKIRGRRFLLSKIAPCEPFHKQLETVDTLLGLEEYDTASDILDLLEKKYSDNWELTARRMMIAGWTGQAELSEYITKIKTTSIAPQTRAACAPERETSALISSFASAWQWENICDTDVMYTTAPKTMRRLADKLILTVYRERLTLNKESMRSGISSLGIRQKPVFSFPSLLTAQMAAEAWKMKKGIATEAPASEEVLKNIASRRPVDKAAESMLLKAYVFEYYKKRLTENGTWNDDAKASVDCMDLIAIILGRSGYKEWYCESFPLLLEQLSLEKDKSNQSKLSADMIKMLESSFQHRSVENDKSMWIRAFDLKSVLEAKGFPAEGNRVQAMMDRAVKQNYSLFLDMKGDMTSASFETFARSFRIARQEAVKQIRSRGDMQRAYRVLGQALSARLQVEYNETFSKCNPQLVERIVRSRDVWKTLSEKTEFGPKVLESFIRLNKNDLFYDSPLVTEKDRPNHEMCRELQQAAEQYGQVVEKLYSLALETDKEMRLAFSSRPLGSASSSGVVPTSELCRYLSRDKGIYMNLASFLINRAIFGNQNSSSTIDTGSLLELVHGTYCAVDMICASSQKNSDENDDPFVCTNRISRRLSQMEKEYTGTNDWLSGRKIHAIMTVLNEVRSGNVHADSASDLEKIAKEALSRNPQDTSENTMLYGGLAMLALLDKRQDEAVALLDKIACARFADKKMKELCVLNALLDCTGKVAKQRKLDAINRLAGLRLTEDETVMYRTILIRENHQKEASTLYRRLLLSASNEKNISALLDEILTRHKEGKQILEEEFVFALKVFRNPVWNYGIAKDISELRGKSLVVLVLAGKLNEVRVQLERQLASAPGSFDLL